MRRGLPILGLVVALGGAVAHGSSEPAPSSVETANARAAMTVNAGDLTVADTVVLRISVAAAPGTRLEWPASLAPGGELAGMTIGGVRDESPLMDARGWIASVREIHLEPFLPGEVEIGPLALTVRHESGDAETLSLPAVLVTVGALLPDGEPPALAGPKGVVDAPEERGADPTVWIVGGSVALVVAAGAVVTVLVRRGRTGPAVSPRQRALASLAILDDRVRGEAHLGERPSNDEAYTALSGILRVYIEGRFGYRATSRTTEEFLRDASDGRTGLPGDASTRLRTVLEACDEVKFGGAEPGMAAAARAIEEVRAYIEVFGDDAGEGA